MLRRLLIAVFVIGLVMAFNGAAFSDTNPDLDAKQIPRAQGTTSDKALVPASHQQQDGTFKVSDFAQPDYTTTPTGHAGTTGSDTSACYEQDYTDYAGASFFYTWPQVGIEWGMRFDIPEKHVAELDGSYFYYRIESGTDATVTLQVMGDAGGVPDVGDIIHTETVVVPDQGGGGWAYVTWTGGPLVLDGYSNYHIAVSYGSVATDDMTFWSDDGGDPGAGGTATGTTRSSINTGSGWVNQAAFWGDGFDPNFLVTSVQCVYFSDCYSMLNFSGSVYLFSVPDNLWSDGSVLEGMGQSFVAEGPETLTAVRFYHYDFSGSDGAGFNYPLTGGPGVTLEIWGDDGTGQIDQVSGPIHSESIPGGITNLFPQTGGDGTADGWNYVTVPMSTPLVLYGPWHVTARMTDNNPANGVLYFPISNPSVNPGFGGSLYYSAPGPGWELAGTSPTWASDVGLGEIGYFIRVFLCRDEFADCQFQATYSGLTTGYGLPLNIAQRIAAKPVNRVEEIYFNFIDPSLFGEPAGTSYEAEVVIWAATPSGPGAELWRSATIPFGDLVPYPGWNGVVIPGGLQVLGDFYVGYENVTADPWYFSAEKDNGPEINGGAWYYSLGSAAWFDLGDAAGADVNAVMEVGFCSIPVVEYPCVPGSDWVTLQHDLARAGHSGNALGDAYCDLTLAWSYEHPSQFAEWAGPIVKDGKVVNAFGNEYVVFDLLTGAVLNNIGPFGNGIACIPTIATIDIATVATEVIFLAGGTDGNIYAYDWNNLAGGPIWTYALPGSAPSARWGNFQVLNDGTIDVVYFGDDNGRIYALEAATGAVYAPWGSPISLTGFAPTITRTGTSDGVGTLFYGANDAGFTGDLYAIDAFAKTFNWQLSSAGGLQGATIFGVSVSDEGFDGGISYEAGGGGNPPRLYVNSAMTGNNPIDGVFYIIDASNGAVIAANASNRNRYATPIVDAQMVYVPSFTRWVNPPAGGDLLAFNKASGALAWSFTHISSTGQTRYYNEGALSCEPDGAADLLFAFSESGYLSCVNSSNGDEIFHRRIDYSDAYGDNIGGAIAIVPDHVVASHYFGGISVLGKTGVDRPRLELLTGRERAGVPFGTATSYPVQFDDLVTNTGCDVLNLTMVADEVSNGSSPLKSTGIGGARLTNSEAIADMMTNAKFVQENTSDILVSGTDNLRSASRTPSSRAASAAPFFLNTDTYTAALNPGDTLDLVLDVNQSLLSRGVYKFYVEYTSDDPDYYLEEVTQKPEVFLQIISGCEIDTTSLYFGVGGANEQLVTNTSRLGDGDWEEGGALSNGFYIDGEGVEYYQGGYVYGVSQRRLAMHTQDWTSGTTPLDGEESAYTSMQPDPNYISGECKPAIATSVVVPDYTLDGLTYTALNASAVYSSFLDSVQDWTIDDVWDWENNVTGESGDFDPDSTFGTYTNSRTIGVVDAPTGENLEYLNQLTTQVFEVSERNGNLIEGLGVAHFWDCDLGGDTIMTNRTISAAWACNAGQNGTGSNDVAMGTVKLPFGLGYEPMVNGIGIVGQSDAQGFWGGGTYWDSVYTYMTDAPLGNLSYTTAGMFAGSTDGEGHFTLVRNASIDGLGTMTFGAATFRLGGLTTASNPNNADIVALANIVNKFAGFGRGDMNNDNVVDISDLVMLANHVFQGGPGAIPFAHLSDVDASGATDLSDVSYMVNYYFNLGPAPIGDWEI